MNYKIAQLNLTPGKKASTTCDIFIAEPDRVKESLAGKLFVMLEIESKRIDSLKMINFLIDNISNNYYQNERIILREKISGLKVEHIFEAALAKTNAHFSELIYNEKIGINLSSINITAGILHENQLYFANTGKNRIFLIYRQKTDQTGENKNRSSRSVGRDEGPELANKYAIIDIAAQAAKKDNEAAPKGKLFTNVVSGEIPSKGHFFISSESVPEYISSRQLIEIITTLPPLSAVEQIKNALAKINAYVSFLGIIIKSQALEMTAREALVRPTSSQSIAGLNTTEETTEALLTPSGIKIFKNISKYASRLFSRDKTAGLPALTLGLKEKVLMKRNTFFRLKKIARPMLNFLTAVARLLSHLFKSIVRRSKAGERPRETIDAGSPLIAFLPLFLRRLNLKGKILFTLLAVLIVVLVVNLAMLKKRNEARDQRQRVRELATLIEQKQNQAEANLLYSNEEGAKKLFAEIAELIGQYPEETDEQQKQLSLFKDKLEVQMETIRRVTRLDEPARLADFGDLNSRARPLNIVYNEDNKRLYAVDGEDHSVYILNTADNLFTTLADLSLNIDRLDFPVIGADKNIFYFNGSAVVILDTRLEALSVAPLNIPDPSGRYQAAGVYGDRYYLLDSAGGQIYRFNVSDKNFSAPVPWLQEKLETTEAVDMSIDGNIYVLDSGGEVRKFLSGRPVEFKLGLIDPPLLKPLKLRVSPDKDFLYILEPENKRLAVFDKAGSFLMQYKIDGFNDLRDFFIDEAAGVIYFLNAASVYSVPATHLSE